MSWGMVGLIVFLVVGVAAWVVWVVYSIATGWDGTDYGDGYQWPNLGDDLNKHPMEFIGLIEKDESYHFKTSPIAAHFDKTGIVVDLPKKAD